MIRSRQTGFTLIELLAVVIVSGIVLAALTSFYLQEQRAMKQQQIQIETSQALRVALEQMVRDLRSAGRNPTSAPGIGFVLAQSHRVEFTLDADFDGEALDTTEERKGFRQTGTALETYVPGPTTDWQPLANFLRDIAQDRPIFRYYDSTGAELPSPVSGANLDRIARVDVALTVTNRVPGAPAIERTETASVELRNR